ncbi:MAG TPA: ABC transporter substrate-binding protein [Chthonomonadaceae bacterium]|nr:ABC transporter substrate-binding protein [Chthonomonadaceae bacterium]
MRLRDLIFTWLLILIVVGAIWYSEDITTPHPEPGPVHIAYWEKWTGFEADAMRDVVNYYNRSQNRIHVDLLMVSGIENKTLMATAGGNPPDVAGLYGPNVAQYADDHAIQPLDAYCRQYGISADQYIPAYWNMGFYHGHVYALPTTPATTALHYDKTMFQQAGLDPNNPPKTIEEMDSDAARITTTDAQGHILKSGFMPSEPGWWNWAWGYFFGGKLWDGKDKITANDPNNVRAFSWVQSYAKKYGVTELQTFHSGFGNFSSPQNAFLSGKVAMELQGVWMSNFINKFAPGLKWGAVPFPYPADRPDLADSSVLDEDILVIPRGAKHPKEAFDFIAFVESQKGMEMLCMGQRKHTPLRKVSAWFWAHHPNPYIKLFADLAWSKNAITPPKIGIWPEYGAELSNAFDEISLMQKTPRQALDEVQARMQGKWDEYLRHLRLRGEAR